MDTPIVQEVPSPIMDIPTGQETPSSIMGTTEDQSEPKKKELASGPSLHEFELVDEVRAVLNMPARADRRKIDRSDCYTNFHTLLDKLMTANGLDSAALDDALDLNDGFTEMQRRDLTKGNIPKDILLKYLDYFGLREFLYEFKEQSIELMKELKGSPEIDKYEIKKAGAKTEEVFTLTEIKSKKVNGINRYRMKYVSDYRTVISVESSSFERIKGRQYQIGGLDPIDTGLQGKMVEKENASGEAAQAVSKEAVEDVLKNIEAKSQPAKPSQGQPKQGRRDMRQSRKEALSPDDQMERDRATVIGWICQTKKVSSAEAKNMIAKFTDHSEAMSSFARYISTKKADTKYARFGYTPRRLMAELHFDIIEAYEMMAALDSDPKGTKQMLKYRETDPQYQRPPKKQES